jgi:hypothetical protein
MVANNCTIEIVFQSQAAKKLVEAMTVFSEIAREHPDDERFQIVTDLVMDAVRITDGD